MLPDNTFANRVAVVTGGGSGIGFAIGQELARLGAAVVLVGRREDVLSEARDRIVETGGSAIPMVCDVRDREAVERIAAEVQAGHGPVGLLVNSAAGNFRAAPEDLSPKAWNAVVRIVLDGTWNWTQVVGRQSIEHGTGASVLNIGTIGALLGGPETVHSASAKAGVVAMSKSLAAAWGPHGIRVNLVSPGITEGTPGASILLADDKTRRAAIEQVPLGRAALLQEVTNAAVYLLSDYAGYTTGANLVVDGGRSLGRP